MRRRLGLILSAALIQAALVLSGCSGAEDSASAGEKAYEAGDYDRAVTLLCQAVSQDDDNPLYFAQLGLAYTAQGEYDDAETSFETALELDAGNTAALRGMGICLLRQGEAEEAAEYFTKALDGISDSSSDTAHDLKAWRAEAERSAGDPDAAASDLQQLADEGYQLPELYLTLGDVYLESGSAESAMEVWKLAVSAVSPDSSSGRSGDGSTSSGDSGGLDRYSVWLHMLQKLSDASAGDLYSEVLQEAENSTPETVEEQCGLGMIYLQDGDTEAAFRCLEQSYNEGYENAGFYLAMCYRSRGTADDYAEADRLYSTMLLDQPDNARLYAAYATSKIEQEDYAGAMILITEGKEYADEDEMLVLLWDETVCEEKQREYEAAAETLREYLQLSPADSSAQEELAYLESRL